MKKWSSQSMEWNEDDDSNKFDYSLVLTLKHFERSLNKVTSEIAVNETLGTGRLYNDD